ncbi:MAG: class I SAM-dependent methyltransferase [Gloeocapsa sp. UFS-A4-WI-NPMV-4B04]|jgi:SAM-dependent methyltransferase|nr:class I SAM-dependent methyltransferase [Gloeocapsa sp. UFS-A4-WI-NPMV-4B04]
MDYQPFKYFIDSPKLSEETNLPFILISGWIIADKESIILNPTICSSGINVHPLTSVNRPDVEAAYPNHSVLGFHQYLPIFDLASEKHWAIDFLVDENRYSFPLHLKISNNFLDTFSKSKATKLQKIINILNCPICENTEILDIGSILQCSGCAAKFSANKSNYNFLPKSLIEYGNVKPTTNVSANNYDPVALGIVEQFKNGIILDNGCGLRNIYYDNVVNFEIVDYPTTDVLGIGEKLPFKTDIFDAVFSLAVLEHVKNPFECAQEIVRVLKPGGILYVAVPFLQPFHGYPDHYYNMTSSGLKNLFSNQLRIIECSVPLAGLPIWCLSWFLNSYIRGLPERVAEEFKNMKVSDLLNNPREYLDKDFVRQLSLEVNEELASVNCLIAKKMEIN